MFSLASFLITLREAIEAALIVGILLIYVTKIGERKLKKQVWIGTIAGIILSILAAVIFQFALGGFEGYEEIFEGFAMTIASLLLTWMIIWMLKTGKDIQKKLEEKVDITIKQQQKYGLLTLALISVLREGVETVLFLTGVGATEDSFWIVLWSGLLGVVVAVVVAVLIFYSGKKINLRLFFLITSIILIIIAAGMFAHGIHEFQEIGWFGSETHWLQKNVWDMSGVLNDKTNELGKFLRALFGYQDKPTWLEIIAYIGYYLILGSVILISSLFSKKKRKNNFQSNKTFRREEKT
ncbi:MAG: FTR1 family iron permease [Candidatus Heimdallarchaeaceae archaeon]